MMNERGGPTWSDVLLPTLSLTPPISLLVPLCLETCVCRATSCIVLFPRISQRSASDSCGHSTGLASVQRTGRDTPTSHHWPYKKEQVTQISTNHPSLPACVAIQTVYRVLWPAHRLLVTSGLWCIICDLINRPHLCSFVLDTAFKNPMSLTHDL